MVNHKQKSGHAHGGDGHGGDGHGAHNDEHDGGGAREELVALRQRVTALELENDRLRQGQFAWKQETVSFYDQAQTSRASVSA